jgi:hypothetical protein
VGNEAESLLLVILHLDETKFRYLLNENAIATEKTADVVRIEKFGTI